MGNVQAYQVFGLRLSSALDLPELPLVAIPGVADVAIRFGSIDAPLDLRPGYSALATGTILVVPDVGRYLIRSGNEIRIEPDPKASDRNIRLFLLGSALGALLHQRGLLPLHANAIEIDGGAVAFSGHSGAGKSTIAAWFHDQGYRILADDVCVIDFTSDDVPLAYPGIPRLRLWREALEVSGRTAEDYHRSFDALDKYDVPTSSALVCHPVPLSHIYFLRKAPEGSGTAEIRRLRGVEAIDALVSNTYRGGYVTTIGKTGQHLSCCLRIAKAVSLFSAQRLWGFEAFDEQSKLLENHCQDHVRIRRSERFSDN
jgi:hypothetical protein